MATVPLALPSAMGGGERETDRERFFKRSKITFAQ